jgi:hypothetical protein
MSLKQVIMGSFIALTSFSFMGCGSTAHVEKDPGTDLKKYKTYSWAPLTDTSKESVAVVSTITKQNIKSTIDNEMQRNGFKLVSRNPDLLLNYDVVVKKTTAEMSDPVYSQPYSRYFYNPYTGRYVTVYYPSQFLGYDRYSKPVKESSIIVSMIDVKTDKTVWQGWTNTPINDNYMSSRDAEKDVKSMFKRFNEQ